MVAKKEIEFIITSTGCHECISHARNKQGYVHVRNNGPMISVHRLIYSRKYGEIPKGMVVRHKCDNPPCCNIEHLELGTKADNVADRVKRGRSRHPKGEDHGRTTLTNKIVINIRKLVAAGKSRREVREKYKLSKAIVDNIISRKTWKHL